MFSIRFKPTPNFSERLCNLPPEKKGLIVDILNSVVSHALSLKPTRYTATIFANMEVEIIAHGIASIDQRASHTYASGISSLLAEKHLNTLFYICSIGSKIEVDDTITAPHIMKFADIAGKLIDIFASPTLDIPALFKCPITQNIMSDPVYLSSNPKISYERSALLEWLATHSTDPATREPAIEINIVTNTKLKEDIYNFTDSVILGKNTEHFHIPTKDAMTITDAGLFASPAETPPKTPLAAIAETCKLMGDFEALLAKALRRAANAGDIELMEQILSLMPDRSRDIVNTADSNPDSHKTPLHLALKRGHQQAVQWLLDHQADPDKMDAQGTTCRKLMQAAGNSFQRC